MCRTEDPGGDADTSGRGAEIRKDPGNDEERRHVTIQVADVFRTSNGLSGHDEGVDDA